MNQLFNLYLAGSILSLFIAFVLFGIKCDHRTANRYMAIAHLRIFFGFAVRFLNISGFYEHIPFLNMVNISLSLTIPPLLYLYVKTRISNDISFKKIDLIHFTPFALCFLAIIQIYIIYRSNILIVLNDYSNFLLPISYPFLFIRIIQGNVYAIVALILLKNHSKNIKNVISSNLNTYSLIWVRNLIIAFFVTYAVFFVSTIILKYYNPELQHYSKHIGNIIIITFLFIFGYKTMVETNLFHGTVIFKEENKYAKSNLDPKKAESYLKILLEYIETSQVYKDTELTIQNISDKVEISPNHISQIINQRLGKNFYDFINKYRLEYAKDELLKLENTNATILEILINSGFKSKSVFNTLFKKYYNITPTEFRKTNRI